MTTTRQLIAAADTAVPFLVHEQPAGTRAPAAGDQQQHQFMLTISMNDRTISDPLGRRELER